MRTLDSIINPRVITFGDLHLSDVYMGRFKDYRGVCSRALARLEKVIVEGEYDVVIFTGDLVGVKNDKCFSTLEFRAMVSAFFMRIAERAFVISLMGNHVDVLSSMSEFGYLRHMGWVTVIENEHNYIDIGNVRYHLIEYGQEMQPLQLGNKSNVVIMHNTFRILGQTDWFYTGNDGFELSSMKHWEKVDIILGGHIHLAAPRILETYINTSKVNLFYVGSPTLPEFIEDRPKICYGVAFIDSDEDTNMNLVEVEIEQDVYDLTKIVQKKERTAPKIDNDLSAIVNDMNRFNYIHGDWRDQLKIVTSSNPRAYELIKGYLDMVSRGNGKIAK